MPTTEKDTENRNEYFIDITFKDGGAAHFEDVIGWHFYPEQGVFGISRDHNKRRHFFPVANILEIQISPNEFGHLKRSGKLKHSVKCPQCGKAVTTYRKRTADYRCNHCKTVFDADDITEDNEQNQN